MLRINSAVFEPHVFFSLSPIVHVDSWSRISLSVEGRLVNIVLLPCFGPFRNLGCIRQG